MRYRAWLSVLVVLSLQEGAAAQDSLEWKFQMGDTFYVESHTTQESKATIADQEIRQNSVNTVLARFKVLKKAADGYVLEETIELVRDKTAGAPAAAPAVGLVKALAGTTFQFHLGARGAITQFSGYDAALEKMARGDASLLKRLHNTVREDSLKAFLEEIFAVVPPRAVQKGATWDRALTVPLGPLGSFGGTCHFIYQGKNKEGGRIDVTADLKFTPSGEKARGLPFKFSGGTLKTDAAAGVIRFDAQAGRLVRSDMTIRFKGDLTIAAAANKTTISLLQEQTVTIRLFTKDPLKK